MLPPTVSHVAPKCGASLLDKPHTCFTELVTQKKALGFSHQAPMLISKSFTNRIYVLLALPHLLYSVCFITGSVFPSLVEISFYLDLVLGFFCFELAYGTVGVFL